MSADTRAAIGCLNRGPEIAAGDSGSHFPVRFSRETSMLPAEHHSIKMFHAATDEESNDSPLGRGKGR